MSLVLLEITKTGGGRWRATSLLLLEGSLWKQPKPSSVGWVAHNRLEGTRSSCCIPWHYRASRGLADCPLRHFKQVGSPPCSMFGRRWVLVRPLQASPRQRSIRTTGTVGVPTCMWLSSEAAPSQKETPIRLQRWGFQKLATGYRPAWQLVRGLAIGYPSRSFDFPTPCMAHGRVLPKPT